MSGPQLPPTAERPCPHCGQMVPSQAVFCDNCGKPLATTPTTPTPTSEAPRTWTPSAPTPPPTRRASPAPWLLAGGGCLAVVLIGAVVVAIVVAAARPGPQPAASATSAPAAVPTATAAPASPTASPTPAGPPLTGSYSNADGAYRLSLPENWRGVAQPSSTNIVDVTGPDGNAYGLEISYLASVTATTARDFWDKTLLPAFPAAYQTNVIGTRDQTFAGRPALEAMIEYTSNRGVRNRSTLYIVVGNGHAWAIELFAPVPDYEQRLPLLKAIAQTFQFTG